METVSQSRQQAFAIKTVWLVSIGTLLLAAVAWWRLSQTRSVTSVFEPRIESLQSEPLCPWREPQEDLKFLFPQATGFQVQTFILSGLRTELSSQLGRPPTGDENALHVYRVYARSTPQGAILTRRVKGNYGAIELVLGVNTNGQVQGLRIQRQREPDNIASAINDPAWLASFAGKTAGSSWALGKDLPDVAVEARASAEAIVQGTRSLLILLAVAAKTDVSSTTHHH